MSENSKVRVRSPFGDFTRAGAENLHVRGRDAALATGGQQVSAEDASNAGATMGREMARLQTLLNARNTLIDEYTADSGHLDELKRAEAHLSLKDRFPAWFARDVRHGKSSAQWEIDGDAAAIESLGWEIADLGHRTRDVKTALAALREQPASIPITAVTWNEVIDKLVADYSSENLTAVVSAMAELRAKTAPPPSEASWSPKDRLRVIQMTLPRDVSGLERAGVDLKLSAEPSRWQSFEVLGTAQRDIDLSFRVGEQVFNFTFPQGTTAAGVASAVAAALQQKRIELFREVNVEPTGLDPDVLAPHFCGGARGPDRAEVIGGVTVPGRLLRQPVVPEPSEQVEAAKADAQRLPTLVDELIALSDRRNDTIGAYADLLETQNGLGWTDHFPFSDRAAAIRYQARLQFSELAASESAVTSKTHEIDELARRSDLATEISALRIMHPGGLSADTCLDLIDKMQRHFDGPALRLLRQTMESSMPQLPGDDRRRLNAALATVFMSVPRDVSGLQGSGVRLLPSVQRGYFQRFSLEGTAERDLRLTFRVGDQDFEMTFAKGDRAERIAATIADALQAASARIFADAQREGLLRADLDAADFAPRFGSVATAPGAAAVSVGIPNLW